MGGWGCWGCGWVMGAHGRRIGRAVFYRQVVKLYNRPRPRKLGCRTQWYPLQGKRKKCVHGMGQPAGTTPKPNRASTHCIDSSRLVCFYPSSCFLSIIETQSLVYLIKIFLPLTCQPDRPTRRCAVGRHRSHTQEPPILYNYPFPLLLYI